MHSTAWVLAAASVLVLAGAGPAPTQGGAQSGARHSGPSGFGNIPYGSPIREAMERNHGNGQVITNENGGGVLAYTTTISGMMFSVTQNYDRSRKAVDAMAVATATETPRSCVARFNYVLDQLQAAYGPPSGAPLASKVLSPDGKGPGGARYVVSFAFDRQDGIEGELTAPDPSGTEPGPCRISLHYLPPGWVGHF